MSKGSKYEILIEPELAYGPEGCEDPKVPADAVIKAEIELIELVRVKDLTDAQDGGVLMKVVEEASSDAWKTPKEGDIAVVNYKVTYEGSSGARIVVAETTGEQLA